MKKIISKIQNNIGFIQINDYETKNRLSAKKLLNIIKFIDKFEKDKNINLIVIESLIDDYFSSGYNINEMDNLNEAESKIFASTGQRLIRKIKSSKKLIISLVDGKALGGGFEIILASDLIFATKGSFFGFPEVNLGIIPAFGGTQLAARKIYETFVKYLIFTGDLVSAEELENKGIISKTFQTKDDMELFLENFSKKISSKSIFALGLAKETINNGIEVDLDKALLIEQNAFTVAFASNDKKEGMTAFIEKRKPIFTDRWEDFEEL